MAKHLSAIRNTVRQVLNDEFVTGTALDWKDDEIDVHLRLCLQEVSEASPYVFREVLTTIANSKVLDISSIEDLIDIEKLEYPTGYSPRKCRNFDELDADTIEIDTTLIPSAGASSTLTGIVTFTNGSAAISGSSTLFTTELKVGYHIKKSSGTRWYRIYSITSDTALVLAEPCLDSGADTVSLTEYCYETVYLYCNKVHTLTEKTSTLRPHLKKLLVDGTTAKVALAWVNAVRTHIKDANSNLTTGADYINTISHGGRPERDYVDYARAELGIASLVNTWQVWANNKLALYLAGLKSLSTFKTYMIYPKS